MYLEHVYVALARRLLFVEMSFLPRLLFVSRSYDLYMFGRVLFPPC